MCESKGIYRTFKELPVWIVEDHNDVLPHVYRAIASRHLPFQGIVMLHFDSHPDLQIATTLDADTVFDKHELFNSLSIENWIVPAVYAGHVNHVVWIKPPWSDQLPEGSRQVHVGRHFNSNKLRISWPDSYFLSDLLYAPKEDLECPKEFKVDVVTMETDLLPIGSACPMHGTVMERRETCKTAICCQVENAAHKCLTTLNHIECETTHQTSCCSCGQGTISQNLVSTAEKRASSVYEVTQSACGTSERYVMDIDLDFFTTRNPFKEIYTESQFHLLEDLYSFECPMDQSKSALNACISKRAQQLKELDTALQLACKNDDNNGTVSSERFDKMKSFIADLQSTSCEPLDAELIHIAGLTCDNSGELPHHVSTEEEIASLVVAMRNLLSRLPKPVMVTIARSSHDDYCPPDQVERIQGDVLRMLQDVYGKLDVHLDYDKQEIQPV